MGVGDSAKDGGVIDRMVAAAAAVAVKVAADKVERGSTGLEGGMGRWDLGSAQV